MDRSYEFYQRFGSETSTALARLINYMFYDNKVTLNLVLTRKQKIPDSNCKILLSVLIANQPEHLLKCALRRKH